MPFTTGGGDFPGGVMSKPFLFAVLWLACAQAIAALTDTETRWLRAGLPVLDYARAQQLPIDVVVQPQAQPGTAPLAMGFVDGRCKLVLTMRGNPQAEAALANVEPPLQSTVIEAMVAHEVGHCWRYVQGAWHGVPSGFAEPTIDEDPERARLRRMMRATRREEGFADLVGLAWTRSRHPERYAQVHAWLEQVRDHQPVPGSHHDTRVWVALAKQASAFGPGGTPFDQAQALWQQGLD
jgi:hypothetical protein